MKTTETQTLSDTQKKVLDFVHKFSDSNAEHIANGTQLNKLIVFKAVKVLAGKGLIKKSTWPDDPDTYKLPIDDLSKSNAAVNKSAKTIAVVEEKSTNVSSKKSAKTEKVDEEKVALPKTNAVKKGTVSKENDEVALPKAGGRDTSKFRFNSETFSKSRLVHAVISKYVLDHPKITLTALQDVFKSQELQKRYGIVVEILKAKRFCEGGRERHFMKNPIKLGVDKKVVIVVSNQWSSELLIPFLKIAKSLNYQIKQQP